MTFINIEDIKRKMNTTLVACQKEFASLRTGTASANALDSVKVDAYGSKTPIAQVASVSVAEARMLAVSVWDKSLVGAVDKAIREANLGFNPIMDGQNLRIPMPPLNEERRKQLVKLSKEYAEDHKIMVRNIRRDAMNDVKKAEKDGMPEHSAKSLEKKIQEATDEFVKKITEAQTAKEKEIMKV